MIDISGAHMHETDVLVIGGGLAGLFAARNATLQGSRVTIIDKGPFGHSGTSGINWGHDMETDEWAPDDGSCALSLFITFNDGLPDQEYSLSLCRAVHEARPNALSEQMGCIAERLRNGRPAGRNSNAPIAVDHGCFPRMFAQDAKRSGIPIFDRTMVLDVLRTEDGRAAGAVAIDLISGEARVFRSKAVVMATGSYCWVAGWNGMSPYTIAGPENTGDGHTMFINAGLQMRDMEQLPFDLVQWTPLGTRQGMGGMGGGIVNHNRILNANKARFTQVIDKDPRLDNATLMRLTMREIWQGRGTEHRGVYVDTARLATDNRYYRRADENQLRTLGYELPRYVECVPEQWETAGRPFHLSTTSETAIPGLYYAGSGSGAWAGLGYFSCVGSGWMAGGGAAKVAANTELPPVSQAKISSILAAAFALLDAAPEAPIRSTDVVRRIQNAYWSGLSPLRDDTGIRATIAELERIQTEDLPRMYVPEKSRRLNSDWRLALEANSLLTCAMGTARAALIRTETRGAHCRTDYPKMDNANWLKNTVVGLSDGAWSVRAVPIDDSLISAAKLAEMIPEVGLD